MLVHTRTIAAMRVDAVAIIPKVRARISPVFRDIVARTGDGLGSGVLLRVGKIESLRRSRGLKWTK
jgi:hypothetical protein